MTAFAIVPAPREAVVLDERKAIPAAWKAAARERSGGVCAYPGCEVEAPLEYDHALCLGLGGKHRAENIQPLCIPHHRAKTNRDLKMIARAKAMAGLTGQQARRKKRGGSSIPAHKNPWPKGRKINGRKPANDE